MKRTAPVKGQRPLRTHAGRCFLSAGAAFAFGLQSAFAWGEPSVMARLIVHDSYQQLSNVSTHGTDLGKLIREDFWLIVTIME